MNHRLLLQKPYLFCLFVFLALAAQDLPLGAIELRLQNDAEPLRWNDSTTFKVTVRNTEKTAIHDVYVQIAPNDWLTFEPASFTIDSVDAQKSAQREIVISTKFERKTYIARNVHIVFSLNFSSNTEDAETPYQKTETIGFTIQPPKFFWMRIIALLSALLVAAFIGIYLKLTESERKGK